MHGRIKSMEVLNKVSLGGFRVGNHESYLINILPISMRYSQQRAYKLDALLSTLLQTEGLGWVMAGDFMLSTRKP